MDADPEVPAPTSEVTVVRRRRRRRRSRSGTHHRRTDRLVLAERGVAIAATVAAIVLQIASVTRAGALWRDEASAVATAGAGSMGEVWRLAEFGPWPPAWLIGQRLWLTVGSSDIAVRFFGLVGGLALIAAVWYASRRLTRSAPLAGLALIAINPEIARWGTGVGPWGLAAALGVLMLVSIREASVALTRRRILIALAVAVVAVHVSPQSGVLLAAVVLAASTVAMVRRRWAEARVSLAIGAVAGALWLPMLGFAERRAVWLAMAHAPSGLGEMLSRIEDAASASGTVVVTCAIGLVAMALASAAQWILSPSEESANRTRRGVASYAAFAVALAPVALAIGASAAGCGTEAWFDVAILSFIAVGAEIAVASAVAARMARAGLVVLACVVLAAGALPAWRATRAPQTNIDAIAAELNTGGGATDLVIVNPWLLATSFQRYYTGAAPVLTIPPVEDHRVYRFDQLKEDMTSGDPLAAVLLRVQRTLESGGRVFLVGGIDTAPSGQLPPKLPAPPLPDTAWQAEPYEYAWSVEVGAFLQAHAVESQEVPMPAGGRYEDAKLAVLKGWK